MNNLNGSFIVTELKKKWWLLLATVCICCMGMLFVAHDKVQGFQNTDKSEKMIQYENTVKEYEDAIADYSESLDSINKEYTNQKDYCDNSDYMKLDSQNIAFNTRQYLITVNVEKNQTPEAVIVNAFNNYILSGLYIGSILSDYEGNANGIKELVSCSVNGSIIALTVMNADSDGAKNLSDMLDDAMFSAKKDFIAKFGEFDIKVINEVGYVRNDLGVLNNQNNNLDRLKTYQINIGDIKKNITDKEVALQTYIDNNKPEEQVIESPKKTYVKYAIFGVILGIAISAGIIMLRFFISDKIKLRENIVAAGVNVLGECDKKGYCKPVLPRVAIDISMIMKKNNSQSILLVTDVVEKDKYSEQINELCNELNSINVKCEIIDIMTDSVEPVKKLMEIKNCITFAQLNHTSYIDYEELRNVIDRYEANMIGAIVLE